MRTCRCHRILTALLTTLSPRPHLPVVYSRSARVPIFPWCSYVLPERSEGER